MDDDLLLFRKGALTKRRLELIQEISDCADEISRIDKEMAETQSHAYDGCDPDEALI
jgi:hypothetical protein